MINQSYQVRSGYELDGREPIANPKREHPQSLVYKIKDFLGRSDANCKQAIVKNQDLNETMTQVKSSFDERQSHRDSMDAGTKPLRVVVQSSRGGTTQTLSSPGKIWSPRLIREEQDLNLLSGSRDPLLSDTDLEQINTYKMKKTIEDF